MNILKIISSIFYTLLFLLLLTMAASLVLTKLNTPIQLKLYSVLSGSMEPKLALGSVIAVVPQNEYKTGDIITFGAETDKTKTVTHRIVEISRDLDLQKISYRTKGDANDAPDLELIDQNRVIGKVVFHLPYLGYGVAFAQTQLGLIMLIVIPATIIIYSELVNIGHELKNMFGKKKVTAQVLDPSKEEFKKIEIEKPEKSGKRFKKKE